MARMTHRRRNHGFTLIEMAITVAIIGSLAAMASVGFGNQVAKSKRSEARSILASIWTSQKAYFNDHREYADSFAYLDFKLDTPALPNGNLKGTYYEFALTRPWGTESFYCVATGNLDGDPWPDVVVIEDGRP